MLLCDLHTHTTASDGSMEPEDSVRLAKSLSAAAIAITDHDTVAGLDRALAEGVKINQKVIPGIELTTRMEGCEIHIVGLFIDYKNLQFAEKVEQWSKTRDQRNDRMIEKLISLGYNVAWKDFDHYRGSVLTKAHIGQLLVERGYADNVTEAMNTYLRKGGAAYVERETPTPEECISLIHQANGLAFVAHINQIDRADPEHSQTICDRLLALGADGLETRYCEYTEFWRSTAEALAEKHHALRSGGSDFHGTFKKNLEMLTGYGDLEVPYEYVTVMEEKLRDMQSRTLAN